ncbi:MULTISPECIES: GNAT family N-acetyltransferase [Bacillus]|jgi:GNAT superfamily N-acetyltransferase|uniref:GNAT family N-acetyltransferase n=1 Tax=Bacillus TaxID=1386 RepID=UPI000C75C094|nr:GNAT family N-acetyltransferase [Bacillus sp. UMB0728]PLR74815.1 GNAT family N-acetyltransferase [Bacillus sp. UMB0728]
MQIRLAEKKDIDQLIRMRWDFTLEDYEEGNFSEKDYPEFQKECRTFLEEAVGGGQWYIWIAEDQGKIISHIYMERIQKVPRPGRITYPFAYMTNVYTVPGYRGKGIGSRLITAINEWIEENHYEFVIVWPSEEGIEFYRRNGYKHCSEPMEYFSKN